MSFLTRPLVLASLCVAVATAAGVNNLPKDYKRCKKHDPKLNECLKDAIQKAVISLQKGASSLGLATIDPLRVNMLAIDQGTGPVSVKLEFRDLDIIGMSSSKVERVKADWDKYYIEADISVMKPLKLVGSYKVNGKVLILPIQGAGHNNLTLEKVKSTLQIFGKPLKKSGQDYFDVDKFKIHFTTQRLHIRLENLFNGDKALGENMNLFLNENWQDILKELQSPMEEALGQTFRAVANRIFHKVPLNQITLPD